MKALKNKFQPFASIEPPKGVSGEVSIRCAPSTRTGSNKSGFTLIEVLIALAVVGLIVTPFIFVEQSVVRTSQRMSRLLTRIFNAKQFLIEQEFALEPQDKDIKKVKNLKQPATTLTYELKKIPDSSSLKKFENVQLEQVTIEWTDVMGKPKKERLVTFVYRKEPRE